jgi:hypothetical protein
MPFESDTLVFEDRDQAGEWRVEYFDDDGGCCGISGCAGAVQGSLKRRLGVR